VAEVADWRLRRDATLLKLNDRALFPLHMGHGNGLAVGDQSGKLTRVPHSQSYSSHAG